MADMRKCIGSTKFGIEAHEAPVTDFPSQPSAKDGLGRMCRVHWTAYTWALRAAARAATIADAALKPELARPAKATKAAKAPDPVRSARGRRPKPVASIAPEVELDVASMVADLKAANGKAH